MWKQIRPAILSLIILTVVTGLLYPLAMTGIANAVFPRQAKGSLIEVDGKVVGSELIGQQFASEKYFRGRLSATTAADPEDASKTVPAPYNASNSAGSNLGPTNKALIDRVKDDVAAAQAENGSTPVPIDMVTSSASGLDPHISPENALFQIPRISKARGLSEGKLRELVERATESRTLGIWGEPRVNVLLLNIALDRLQ
ncbi:MAG: potassium-transporting ATPase, subunit [Hyphomicrobiales bacterium]|jgi:K+-transporting ATPase ATPase C chain|nr:potassium-transporting ATPase, subunit [Hyphomicrobiales bacterium]